MVFRRRPPREPDPLAHVDPAAAPRRLAATVSDALAARRRFGELVDGLRPGPVRERLGELAPRLDAGVAAVWDAAGRVGELERVLATLDPERVTGEYKHARRSGVDPEVLAAHQARFDSVQRLLNAIEDSEERLRLLDVRLDGAVARAAEVALGTGWGRTKSRPSWRAWSTTLERPGRPCTRGTVGHTGAVAAANWAA